MTVARRQPSDLFDSALAPALADPLAASAYSAKDIEVLEGLEPVRRRPGMYIGGTDERALHHLFAEVLDNSMDEAVAGHAKLIEVQLHADGALSVRDDGRGVPVDPHPKHPGKSALEVILTVLHSGGKFSGKAYETSGGLHGVGVSVVNALSDRLDVSVQRDGFEWRQSFSRGHPLGAHREGRGHQEARHHGAVSPRSGDLRRGRGVQARAPLPHGALQGLPVPGRGDPLALRSLRGSPTPRRPRPASTSPTAWPTS